MTLLTGISSCQPGHSRARGTALIRMGMIGLMLVARAGGELEAADGSRAAARPRIVDPAIQPAGGVGCTSCGPAGCRQSHGGHHGHHSGCRDGVCVPYCPVRPQQFGFYGTQWRRWPGQVITPVSAERDAAPVAPPKSAVPGPAEESLSPQGDGEAAGDANAGESTPTTQPLPEPAVRPQPTPGPDLLEPAPETRPEPKSGAKTEPQPEPPMELAPAQPRPAEETKPAEPEPAKQAPETKPRPEDENLFEVLSGWRARRKFPVGPAGGTAAMATPTQAEVFDRVGHTEAAAPPRVPFDPAAETRRLRSVR